MLETDRLILRQWQDADIEPFARMNADPEVMRYFPCVLSFEESKALFCKMQNITSTNGWGWWARESKESGEFIGATGLVSVLFEAHFVPAVEVGWRIRREHWRKGFATEAATAAKGYAKNKLRLPKLVSFTACQTVPSIGVMKKIGMSQIQPNFNHPNAPAGHPLQEHVVFEVKL